MPLPFPPAGDQMAPQQMQGQPPMMPPGGQMGGQPPAMPMPMQQEQELPEEQEAEEEELNITKILESTNLAEHLDEQTLLDIGTRVVEEFNVDVISRQDWLERTEDWLKLAAQAKDVKTYPWANAANVKYPLMATAAMQFAARAYPALVPGLDIVNIRVIGQDNDGAKQARAERIRKHMSYQILEEMPDWEEDMDKLCIMVPIIGCAFKKTYYDAVEEVNKSELIHAKDLVVNYYAKSLEAASRKTHILYRSPNEIKEKQLNGVYLDVELDEAATHANHKSLELDKIQGTRPPAQDKSAPYVILEQHRFWDLDEDGYEEPYIITVEEKSKKVLRIVARFEQDSVKTEGDKIVKITPTEYFTMFSFIPNPDGGFYPMGFGTLLGPINETVNTLINQLLDSGTLSNLQSGFLSKGIRIKGGKVQFDPGEWKVVNATGDDLRKGVFPMPVREPSSVLFQLLGTIVQSGKELASIAEIFTGKMPGQNTPATTTMAAVEQGLKVFSAIHKRLFRALKKEYQKLYRLNKIYLDAEKEFIILDTGNTGVVQQSDYRGDDTDVRPAADPTAITETQKLMKAQGLMELLQFGTINPKEATLRVLQAQGHEDVQKLMDFQPPPDPKAQEAQQKMQIEQQKAQADMQAKQMEMQMKQMEAQITLQKEEMNLQAQKMQMMMKQMSDVNDVRVKELQGQMKLSQQSEKHQLDMKQLAEKQAVKSTKEKATQ